VADEGEVNYASMNMKKGSLRRKWNCNEIMKGLFLGDEESATNIEQLARHNITHIISVIGGRQLFDDKKYLVYDLFDSGEQDIITILPESNAFVAEGRSSGGVLVHCQKGVSRSSTIVIAYVMSLGYSFYDAADLVCAKRPIVCPNLGFIKQLQLYEKMEFKLNGETEHHKQYRKIKMKSYMVYEKMKWQKEHKTNVRDLYSEVEVPREEKVAIGDTLKLESSSGYCCNVCD